MDTRRNVGTCLSDYMASYPARQLTAPLLFANFMLNCKECMWRLLEILICVYSTDVIRFKYI